MSYLKSRIVDDCPDCGGTGEIITPISIPTTHHSFPGYAYDEAWEPCGACAGTGEDIHLHITGPSLEQAAEEHALILAQREQDRAPAF